MKLFLLIISSCVLLASCSQESEQQTSGVNLERNIFQEVKEQTVRDPNDADAWYHLADLYENSGMYREEIDTLKKVISLAPDKGYAYVKQGMAYNRIGQYAAAVKSFSLAKKYFPKNPLIYNNLAVSYGMLGKISEEIRELEHAIALRPHYATARYNLAMVLMKQGKRDEAMNQYRELVKFDKNVAEALKKELDKKGR